MVTLLIGSASFFNFGNVFNADAAQYRVRKKRRQESCSNPKYYKCAKSLGNCKTGYICPFWGHKR